jgi:choline dehydrogenase-like flavoprotein
MIENSVKAVAERTWDIVVVGAGTVGLFIASILAERGVQVLCLESGGHAFESEAQKLNENILSGLHHVGVSDARARLVGGTSTLWGGQLARFTKVDFEARPDINRPAWPIAYDELEPWYQKAAEYLNVTSYSEDYKETLWKIFGKAAPSTDAIEFYVTHWLKTPNLAKFFRQSIQKKSNLVVCTHAQVVKIQTSDDGCEVNNILVSDWDGNVSKVRARQYILSNGTMEISRLLLISALHDRKAAWAGNSHIGAYFQDHLDVECGSLGIKDKKHFAHFFENALVNGSKVQPKLRLTQGRMARAGSLNVGGSIRFESNLGEDLGYLKTMVKSFLQPGGDLSGLAHLPKHLGGLMKIWGPLVWRYIKDRRIMAFMDGGVYLRAHMEQRPLKESCIMIEPAVLDRFGMPQLKLTWQVDWVSQMRSLQTFCDGVADFISSHQFGQLIVHPRIIAGDIDFLRGHHRDSFHQCGGAIMSHSADTGVVNKNCLIHGTRNLYVAGAAIFPSSSYANPTFTAFALANRLAAKLSNA